MPLRCMMVVAGLFFAYANAVLGYLVTAPLSLDKLTAEADMIFKGTTVSSEPVQDDWFKLRQGFVAQETQFKVISVIKGDTLVEKLLFRHYDESPVPQGRMFQPQFYHFVPGRTYIVFAKQTGTAVVFRQLSASHTGKKDQGVVWCSDNNPVTAKTVKEVLWNELTASLNNASVSNVIYGIRQLDQMSSGDQGGRWHAFDSTQDFDRSDVLTAIQNLMTNQDSAIAQSAITAVGSRNPYLSDERTEYWLATIGSAEIPGIGKMDSKMKNPGGEKYWRDLVALADCKGQVETRALAIRALGLIREPSLRESITRWLADTKPAVRASATLLLADFPEPDAIRQLTTLASDSSPDVRACVAHAIGFAQQVKLANILGQLLTDKESQVRKAAAMSLLSFSPKNDAIAEVFRANLDTAEFQPLFLNALASEKPESYRDGLAETVEKKTEPINWWGGQIPAFRAWELLFKYLQAQPAETVRSGKLDRYLDALEQVGNYSSSEPRDIYAFYIQRGMTERAKKFRETAKQRVSYNLDYFFNMVDTNPALYKRE